MNFNKKYIFCLLLTLSAIFSTQSMSKLKLTACVTGLGVGCEVYKEYKQSTGQQPSIAVQNWTKKTLKAQGVSDKELSNIKIATLTPELISKGIVGFAAIKDSIYVSISHRELRSAQIDRACWLAQYYYKAVFRKKEFNPLLELRQYATTNPIELWQAILAHEWYHIKEQDYYKTPEGELERMNESVKKNLSTLPAIALTKIPELVSSEQDINFKKLLSEVATFQGTEDIIEKLKKNHMEHETAKNNERIVTDFREKVIQICTERVEKKSEEYNIPATQEELTKTFPAFILKCKDTEREADENAITIYKDQPEKLWATAHFYKRFHEAACRPLKVNSNINIFDNESLEKYTPVLLEEYNNFFHPTSGARAVTFAKAAREAELRTFGRTE